MREHLAERQCAFATRNALADLSHFTDLVWRAVRGYFAHRWIVEPTRNRRKLSISRGRRTGAAIRA
jgi:hypothetical protein